MVSCKFSLKPIQRLEFCTFAFENQLEGQKIALEDDFPGAFPLVSGHEISAGERYGACSSEELRSTLQGSRDWRSRSATGIMITIRMTTTLTTFFNHK
jgi:hypothetical protein